MLLLRTFHACLIYCRGISGSRRQLSRIIPRHAQADVRFQHRANDRSAPRVPGRTPRPDSGLRQTISQQRDRSLSIVFPVKLLKSWKLPGNTAWPSQAGDRPHEPVIITGLPGSPGNRGHLAGSLWLAHNRRRLRCENPGYLHHSAFLPPLWRFGSAP